MHKTWYKNLIWYQNLTNRAPKIHIYAPNSIVFGLKEVLEKN